MQQKLHRYTRRNKHRKKHNDNKELWLSQLDFGEIQGAGECNHLRLPPSNTTVTNYSDRQRVVDICIH